MGANEYSGIEVSVGGLGVAENYSIVQREGKELGANFGNIYANVMKANAIKRSSYKVEKMKIINTENFFFLYQKTAATMKVCASKSE